MCFEIAEIPSFWCRCNSAHIAVSVLQYRTINRSEDTSDRCGFKSGDVFRPLIDKKLAPLPGS
jgi:hypothetical protein